VVRRAINQHGDALYDVYEGAARRAWGLKDEATAQRWLRRLSSTTRTAAARPRERADLLGVTDEPTEADETEDADDSFVPPRVWWNES
jgi:hypothetical protein